MRRIALALALCMLISACATPALAQETGYSQSPILDEAVASGALPPVAERLPAEPKLLHEILDEYIDLEIGNYGGTLNGISTDPNFYAKYFTGMNEGLLSMSSANSDEIIGNILKDYETNDDFTEFTLHLREGLRWSDGTPVTMDDFAFTIDHFLFNDELTPVVPKNMRAGGSSSGAPLTFEMPDAHTLKVISEAPYGGFLVVISIASWAGYTDLLKPAHFLKPFHKDFAEECHGSLEAYYAYLAPFAQAMGYDDPEEEGVWTYVFHQVDMTNWETTNPNAALTSQFFPGLTDANFPVLYGWVMESSQNYITRWVRNPYYFKVDAQGQQLPYVDYLELGFAENDAVKLLMLITGAEDYVQEEADKYSILVENEEQGGYEIKVGQHHNIPTTIMINATYGLNSDGTVKDDADSKAWQEVVGDARFRKALTTSIDADEVIDIYLGLAEKNPRYDCSYDIEGANALLDEMGMFDLDGDGFRETPGGQTLQWQIWTDTSNTVTLTVPFCELLVEYWTQIGLDVSVYSTDSSLLASSLNANEIPMRVYHTHADMLWHYRDWALNSCGVLWNAWVQAGGMSGDISAQDAGNYLEPPAWYLDLVVKIESLMTVDPVVAVNELIPEIAKIAAEEMYLILPVTNAGRLMIVNSDLGNVPTGGLVYSWNMGYEQVFYRSFTYED
ncbi:MAG: ABC transporter substrate-binding protein [Christensenellales bacterium]|jgi:peptide/nickel transport system substrate-binding protein